MRQRCTHSSERPQHGRRVGDAGSDAVTMGTVGAGGMVCVLRTAHRPTLWLRSCGLAGVHGPWASSWSRTRARGQRARGSEDPEDQRATSSTRHASAAAPPPARCKACKEGTASGGMGRGARGCRAQTETRRKSAAIQTLKHIDLLLIARCAAGGGPVNRRPRRPSPSRPPPSMSIRPSLAPRASLERDRHRRPRWQLAVGSWQAARTQHTTPA